MCLDLLRRYINRSARTAAVILSIKGRLTEWVMSGNPPSVRGVEKERERLPPVQFDLAV